MKRFTETTKWGDPWFQDMPMKLKAFWFYIHDACDSAGVWKVNMRLAAFQIGEAVEASEVLRVFSGRVEDIGEGRWWIKGFVQFQFGKLSRDCKPHMPVFACLEKHGIPLEKVIQNNEFGKAIEPYPIPFERVQEKEKEKEKDRGGVPGGGVLTPVQLRLNAIIGRRNSTRWSDKEIKSFRAIGEIEESDWKAIEGYYAHSFPEKQDFRRRDLLTLLNNFNGEIDRSRKFVLNHETNKATSRNGSGKSSEREQPALNGGWGTPLEDVLPLLDGNNAAA